MKQETEEFLEHFGVKGMRWGVRRKRGSDGRVGGDSSGSKGSDGDSGKSKDSGGGSRSKGSGGTSKAQKLSTKELQEAVNRMNLENQYNKLSSDRAKKDKTIGQKFASKVLDIGANVVTQQVTSTANKVLGKAIDDKLIAKGLINPPKKKKK